MSEYVLTASNLHFAYQSKGENLTILSGTDLALARGETVAVVGASGTGGSERAGGAVPAVRIRPPAPVDGQRPGAGEDLAGRQQPHQPAQGQGGVAPHLVVLVAAEGGAPRVRVRLQQVDARPAGLQAGVGGAGHGGQHRVAGQVLGHDVAHPHALRPRVLRVLADVDVQARPAGGEAVRAAARGGDVAEDLAHRLVDAQRRALAAGAQVRAVDPVLGLDPDGAVQAPGGGTAHWPPFCLKLCTKDSALTSRTSSIPSRTSSSPWAAVLGATGAGAGSGSGASSCETSL